MRKRTEISIHVIFWLFYMLQSTLTYPQDFLDKYGYLAIGVKQATMILVFLFAFYSNYLYLVPKFLSKMKFWQFGISQVLLLSVTLLIAIGHAYFLDWFFGVKDFFINDRLTYLPYFGAQVFFYQIVGVGAKFTRDWFHSRNIRNELEKEKTQSELAQLKYQISPHFLFNTLNNIYTLVTKNSPKAAEAVLKLSDLMRYALRENGEARQSTLKSEAQTIENFIGLQKLRIPDPGKVSFIRDGDFGEQAVEPMLLLPFIENAFKHGDLSGDGANIDIRLNSNDGKLIFSVVNSYKEQHKDSTSGIGIRNVRRRLELLYPGKYKLDVKDSWNIFEVNLMLELK